MGLVGYSLLSIFMNEDWSLAGPYKGCTAVQCMYCVKECQRVSKSVKRSVEPFYVSGAVFA